MATSSTDEQSDFKKSLVQLGRNALDVLEIREKAAKYGAERLELQALLSAAEAGNPEALEAWLKSHQEYQPANHNAQLQPESSGDVDAKLQRIDIVQSQPHSSLIANEIETLTAHDALDANLAQAVRSEHSKIASSLLDNQAIDETPVFSAWSELVLASKSRRQTELAGGQQMIGLAKVALDDSLNDGVATIKRKSALKSESLPDGVEKSKPASLSSSPELAAAANGAASVAKQSSGSAIASPPSWLEESSAALKPAKKIRFDVRAALNNEEGDKADLRKRAIRWLSGSVGVSVVAHVILTVALGIAVFPILQQPQPLKIVSSATESVEQLEAPLEMPPMEELELTEVSNQMPAPALSSAFDAPATTSLALSESALGPISAPTSNPLGSAVGQATGMIGGTGDMTGAVQFFGASASGNTFAFLVDNSPSIKGAVFDSAKAELMRSVSKLKETQRFYVCFFGKEIMKMPLDKGKVSDFPVYATPDNLQKLARWVASMSLQDGADPSKALEFVIGLEPDAIFLMFDGDTKVDVVERVKRFNRVTDLIGGTRPKAPIHTIRFPPSKYQSSEEPTFDAMMKKLAADNGGTSRFVGK